MEQAETSTEKTLTPQQLAKRLRLSPRATRQLLRSEYPREVKNKRWEIPATLAKKVEKEFKAKVKESDAKKQAQMQNELERQS